MSDTAPTTVTPLEGKTTIDDKMFFEPTRLSYQSADLIAQRIANKVQAETDKQIVVIAGAPLLADFANLQAVCLSLESLQKDYENLAAQAASLCKRKSLLTPKELKNLAAPKAHTGEAITTAGPLASALAPATAMVSAALGLVSLFREDVEYRGLTTVVDPLAFDIALAARVKVGGARKVFVPDLMAIPLAEARAGSLRDWLGKVQEAKARAWAGVGPLIIEMVNVEAKLDEAAREGDQELFDKLSTQVSNMRRDLQPISDPLSRADQQFAELQNKWNQPAEPSGLSQLARLLRAEAIHAMNPLYLHAHVVSSGGHHRISRHLLRMLIFGDGLSFTGGAIARWALLNKDGSLEKGGMLTERLKDTFGTLTFDSE